jgi:hypothetical protein
VIQDEKLEEAFLAGATQTEPKKKDQFHFSQRAAQTAHSIFREHGTNTDPPPHKTFSDTVNQWSVFDAYMEDIQMKEKSKEKKVILLRRPSSLSYSDSLLLLAERATRKMTRSSFRPTTIPMKHITRTWRSKRLLLLSKEWPIRTHLTKFLKISSTGKIFRTRLLERRVT